MTLLLAWLCHKQRSALVVNSHSTVETCEPRLTRKQDAKLMVQKGAKTTCKVQVSRDGPRGARRNR